MAIALRRCRRYDMHSHVSDRRVYHRIAVRHSMPRYRPGMHPTDPSAIALSSQCRLTATERCVVYVVESTVVVVVVVV